MMMLRGCMVLMLVMLSTASSQISVVKHWSTAVSQSGTAKLACKANNGAQIRSQKKNYLKATFVVVYKLCLYMSLDDIHLNTFLVSVNGPTRGEGLSLVLMEARAAETREL